MRKLGVMSCSLSQFQEEVALGSGLRSTFGKFYHEKDIARRNCQEEAKADGFRLFCFPGGQGQVQSVAGEALQGAHHC